MPKNQKVKRIQLSSFCVVFPLFCNCNTICVDEVCHKLPKCTYSACKRDALTLYLKLALHNRNVSAKIHISNEKSEVFLTSNDIKQKTENIMKSSEIAFRRKETIFYFSSFTGPFLTMASHFYLAQSHINYATSPDVTVSCRCKECQDT